MRVFVLFCCFSLCLLAGGAAFAQQAAWQGASFKPIVAQSSITDTEPAKLQFLGLMQVGTATAPYRFEWREDHADGKLISKGSIADATVSTSRSEKNTTLEVQQPGTYYLIVYDASNPTKRAVTRHQVAILQAQ